MVVEAEIFPVVLTCLKDKDEYVKKNACTLIREIAKHTPEVKQAKQKSSLHGTVIVGVNFLDKTPICFICSEACSAPADWVIAPRPLHADVLDDVTVCTW